MHKDKPLHIGLVLPAVPGYSETFFRNKIHGLQQSGFRVTLFVKNGNGAKGFICPVKVHPKLAGNPVLRGLQTLLIFLKLMSIAPHATMRMIKITQQHGYSFMQALRSAVIGAAILPEKLDWLHFGFATTAIEREFVGRAISAKVAVSFRGFDLNQTPLLEKNPYQKLWPQVDKIHSISSYLIVKGRVLGMKTETPFQIITPAINVEAFKPSQSKRKSHSILLVSRLHWIKGIEGVLEAFYLVKEKINDVELTLVGEGEEHERLVFATHQLGIVKSVHFVGKKNREEIIALMQKHEVFVQYSHQEGFCNAVLEAQATGMLCIVSDAEGLQENVLDGKTGWVVPKRNPKALAEKISEVISLPNTEKEIFRNSAIRRVSENFNLKKQREAFVAFYTK